MKYDLPPLIFLTGADGAGKSTVSKRLVDLLNQKGIKASIVWSRFRNYLSKPLLGMARLSGHNYFKEFDGILFGYHDFDKLKVFRLLYVLMQSIDVNIASFFNITNKKKQYDVLICERGPWDTLVDVSADTGLYISANSMLGKFYTAQVRSNSKVILIDRSKENILQTRPELIYDTKLDRKINAYRDLAEECGWEIIDNNRKLSDMIADITNLLRIES